MTPALTRLAMVILLASLFSASVSAQSPASSLFAFKVDLYPQEVEIPFLEKTGYLNGTIIDLSRDQPSTLVPGGAVPTVEAGTPHHVELSAAIVGAPVGWVVSLTGAPSFDMYAGQIRPFSVSIQVNTQARENTILINVTARFSAEDGTVIQQSVIGIAGSPGNAAFNLQGTASKTLAPREKWDTDLTFTNLLLSPRAISVEVAENPCNMLVGLPSRIMLDGRNSATGGRDIQSVTVEAPSDKLVYLFGDQCNLTLKAFPSDRPSESRQVFLQVTVQGGNITFPVVFNTMLLLAMLLLVILFIRRRKEVIEEEILGKPQKPWTIPVEQVYLRHLKAKDERAWYVVRHYLMEDEYRSALLWYNGYKSATKGARKKERLVLAQERQYGQWRKAWERAVARPLKIADKYEAKLTRKLARKAKAAHRKEMRAFRRETSKLKAAHLKQTTRANEKFAKQAAKASKKGLAPPEKQVIPLPDFAPEPKLASVSLASHKWSKKAAKYRAKMGRKQGNLEVKFEKADARKQAKLQRRLAKLARKLDDPDFLAEHKIGAASAK